MITRPNASFVGTIACPVDGGMFTSELLNPPSSGPATLRCSIWSADSNLTTRSLTASIDDPNGVLNLPSESFREVAVERLVAVGPAHVVMYVANRLYIFDHSGSNAHYEYNAGGSSFRKILLRINASSVTQVGPAIAYDSSDNACYVPGNTGSFYEVAPNLRYRTLSTTTGLKTSVSPGQNTTDWPSVLPAPPEGGNHYPTRYAHHPKGAFVAGTSEGYYYNILTSISARELGPLTKALNDNYSVRRSPDASGFQGEYGPMTLTLFSGDPATDPAPLTLVLTDDDWDHDHGFSVTDVFPSLVSDASFVLMYLVTDGQGGATFSRWHAGSFDLVDGELKQVDEFLTISTAQSGIDS